MTLRSIGVQATVAVPRRLCLLRRATHVACLMGGVGTLVASIAVAAQADRTADPFGDAAWITYAGTANALEQAQWLWVAQPGQSVPTTAAAPIGTVRFRAELTLDEPVPEAATLWLAADNFARVTVNGKMVGENAAWWSPDALAVAQALVPGRNVIEIEARNDPGQTGASNPAGLLAALESTDAAGHQRIHKLEWTSIDGRIVHLGPGSTSPWNYRAPSGPCPIFRREFSVDADIDSARIFVVGLGHFDLRVNGERVGDTLIDEPWSEYDKRIYYQEFDLTERLRQGVNAVGVLLGNGFWRVASPPAGRWTKGDAMPDFSAGHNFLLRARVEIRYTDGRVQSVETGRGWRAMAGPVVFSHVYAGEDFDARLESPGWDAPGFDDAAWQAAEEVDGPGARLEAQDFPGLRAHEVFRPTQIREVEPGTWTYVFAQNCSAILRFQMRGPAGAVVEMLPSEVMDASGVVRQLNLHGTSTLFNYTLRGSGIETHQWLFHYHGFQYVQVKGAVPLGQPNPKSLPVLESLELVHVRADNPESGAFSCSSDLYNRTHDLVDWAMRSNMSYVLTDCPHREKLGWLECAHLLARSFLYRYDCDAWLRKITRDIDDAQLPSGRILTVAPRYLMRDEDDAYAWTVEWGAAGVLLPWQLYEWTGDTSVLRDSYDCMRRFVDHVGSISPDHIAPGSLGDWYDYGHGQPPGPSRFTPTDLSATACWAMCIDAVARAAHVLEREEDEAHYLRLFAEVRRAFLDRFYDAESHQMKHSGSPQTANAMALCANLVPAEDRSAVLEAIIVDLEKRGWQQTPGDVGHLFFIRALAEAGRSDVLHRVYSRTAEGSYGGILSKGLTTMPETWDAITVGSNSLNHCMLGHVVEWFYGWVLGIRQAPGSTGWRDMLIAPEPGELEWCRGGILTPRGRVMCTWEQSESEFRLAVSIPPGPGARVVLPEGCSNQVDVDEVVMRAKRGLFGRPELVLPTGDHTVRGDRR